MDLKKEIDLNKKILVILVLISILTIGVNISYSLFQTSVKLDNVVEIHGATELLQYPMTIDEFIAKKSGKAEEGIYGVNPEEGTICNSDCKEYRYTGTTVKNYVKLRNIKPETVDKEEPELQDELWRIIGIFTDSETGEKYMRLVRNEVLPEVMLPENYVANGITYRIKGSYFHVFWNYVDENNRNNNWTTAGLQYYLNEEDDESGNKGYMSYLSEETKGMLEKRTHYLGTVIYNNDTAVSGYQHERDVLSCEGGKGATSNGDNFPVSGCNVWDGNDATWKGSISLMYPSDYGFSADIDNWSSTKLYSYDIGAKNTTWIYTTMQVPQSQSAWLLSPSSHNNSIEMYLGQGGYASGNSEAGQKDRGGALPVLNLTSHVKIKDGKGTESEPYILSV